MMSKKNVKEIAYVFVSNFILIIVGCMTGFILPKILGVSSYGYYKIFNLYTTYTVFFNLGISNGAYLMYGGYTIETVPRNEIRLLFKTLFITQVVFAIGIFTAALIFFNNEYKFIFMMLAIYLVFNNIADYYEKISVALGELKALSLRNIIKSALTFLAIMLLFYMIKLPFAIEKFKIYIILFVMIYMILAIQYVWRYKELSFGKSLSLYSEKSFIVSVMFNGFVLLTADMVANVVLTLDRQFVAILYDIDTYSIYSFAYSILKIITLAVSAISSILYPTLKKMQESTMLDKYGQSLAIVAVISFACMLSYYPLGIIVEYFLPEYINSIPVFRVLFPAVIINLVISLLILNYFKALQKQKAYFIVSLIVLGISIVTNILAQEIFHAPVGLAYASVLTMFIWCIISDFYLKKYFLVNSGKFYLYTVMNVLFFYLISRFIKNYYYGLGVNFILFGVLTFLIYKDNIRFFFLELKGEM